MKRSFLLTILSIAIGSAFASVNFPYPQERNYANGTYVKGKSDALKSRFEAFYASFYEESGNLARIKFDDNAYTVSEGIGYGMIMMVYFSDNKTSYQSQFDKLWAYYNNFTNSNGLMNWQINGFSNAIESNAATDADFDVAFALAMAYYQFGDEKYKTAAKSLIAKIRQHEMETNGLHKPGDAWNTYRNPSYVSPAAFEIFKLFDSNESEFWSRALTVNYTLLKNNQNSQTGLPSGWSDDNGSPINGNNDITAYDYDAPRAPWRWAWSYLWYGHADAATLLSKLSAWVNTKSANELKVPMNLSTGAPINGYSNSTAVGPLTCALLYSSNYSSKAASNTSTLLNYSGESYFNSAMQILSGLLLTGNMQNFSTIKANSSSSAAHSSSSAASSSSQAAGTTDFIDDFEDGDSLAYTGGVWYAYTDQNDANGVGASTITNPSNNDDGYNVVFTTDNSSQYMAGIKGVRLSQGSNPYEPYVALGLKLNSDESAYDLSHCTSISYKYKGAAHNFKAEDMNVKDYAYHYTLVSNSSAWKTVSFSWTDLTQPSWTKDGVSISQKRINKFTWEIKGDLKGSQPTYNYLYIDDVRCNGMSIIPVEKSSSSMSKPSSSSAASSSSVSKPSSSSAASSSSAQTSSSSGKSSASASYVISGSLNQTVARGHAIETVSISGVSSFNRQTWFLSSIGNFEFSQSANSLTLSGSVADWAQIQTYKESFVINGETVVFTVNVVDAGISSSSAENSSSSAESSSSSEVGISSSSVESSSSSESKISSSSVESSSSSESKISSSSVESSSSSESKISSSSAESSSSSEVGISSSSMESSSSSESKISSSSAESSSSSEVGISSSSMESSSSASTAIASNSTPMNFSLAVSGKSLNISSVNPIHLEIFDMQGRIIKKIPQAAGTISLSTMQSGSYIVRIQSGNSHWTKRISIR